MSEKHQGDFLTHTVDLLINCLYATVVWMLESILGNRVVKFWNNLQATVEDFVRKF